jgi:eukaryotic-like serine/threonine-protein kinase
MRLAVPPVVSEDDVRSAAVHAEAPTTPTGPARSDQPGERSVIASNGSGVGSADAFLVGAASDLAVSDYERRLDAAYTEYIARVAAGEEFDEESFCRRHSAVRSSLARLISAHRFLDDSPRLLSEGVPEGRAEAQVRPEWPRVGELFEGFQLLRELGRGAFSRVYLARQPALGDRLVAVKVTPHANYEAAALGRAEHPHIVPVHSVHQAAGRGLSIVCMPYRGRVTLHQIIDSVEHDRPLPPARALLDACGDQAFPGAAAPRWLRRADYLDAVRAIAGQLADALAHLHEHGTCHRDLKPSNVLLQPDGAPLLLDFNLSDNAATPNVCLGGTPAYMAPEQLQAMKDKRPEAIDGKADVFALGVILYEWLAGTLPFGPVRASLADENLLDVITRQRRGPAPLIEQRPEVDAAFARLIEQCLAFEPAQRPTARQVADALRRQLQPQRRLARAASRRPRLAATLVGLMLAVGLAATAYGLARPSADARAYQDGVTAYHEGRFEQAEEHFNRAVVMKPKDVKYRYALARTWQQLCERKREYAGMAAAEYHAAEKLLSDPRHAAGLGFCFQRLENHQVARFYYEKALDGGYESAGVLNNLACCCLLQADRARALKHLERALELEPTLVQAHWNLAMVQKHVWAPLMKKSQQEQASNPVLREAITIAKHHISQAIALSGTPSADMLAHAAHARALGVIFDPADADEAMKLAQRAVDAGMAPPKLLEDVHLRRVLEQHAGFQALAERRPGGGVLRLSRFADPLSGL